jgi:hypothetical protein
VEVYWGSRGIISPILNLDWGGVEVGSQSDSPSLLPWERNPRSASSMWQGGPRRGSGRFWEEKNPLYLSGFDPGPSTS